MGQQRKSISAAGLDASIPRREIFTGWPNFDLINDRFASGFGLLLAHKLQIALQGQRLETTTARYSDCLISLGPTCMVFELKVNPLEGHVWFCMDISVISTIVEAFFGEDVILTPVAKPRDLSRTEQRVVHHIIDALMQGIDIAWASVLPVKANSKGLTPVDQLPDDLTDENLVVAKLALLLDSTELACQLVYPYRTLEQYEDLLRFDEEQSLPLCDQGFSTELPGRLMRDTRVVMNGTLLAPDESDDVGEPFKFSAN